MNDLDTVTGKDLNGNEVYFKQGDCEYWQIFDENNMRTHYHDCDSAIHCEYDSDGNLLLEAHSTGAWDTFEYDSLGNFVTEYWTGHYGGYAIHLVEFPSLFFQKQERKIVKIVFSEINGSYCHTQLDCFGRTVKLETDCKIVRNVYSPVDGGLLLLHVERIKVSPAKPKGWA